MQFFILVQRRPMDEVENYTIWHTDKIRCFTHSDELAITIHINAGKCWRMNASMELQNENKLSIKLQTFFRVWCIQTTIILIAQYCTNHRRKSHKVYYNVCIYILLARSGFYIDCIYIYRIVIGQTVLIHFLILSFLSLLAYSIWPIRTNAISFSYRS